jgi:hypothetical protein
LCRLYRECDASRSCADDADVRIQNDGRLVK